MHTVEFNFFGALLIMRRSTRARVHGYFQKCSRCATVFLERSSAPQDSLFYYLRACAMHYMFYSKMRAYIERIIHSAIVSDRVCSISRYIYPVSEERRRRFRKYQLYICEAQPRTYIFCMHRETLNGAKRERRRRRQPPRTRAQTTVITTIRVYIPVHATVLETHEPCCCCRC